MEKYVLDYSETSYFKGLRILYPYIEEGLLYAQQNNIKDICVWTQGDWTKQNVNFDFLNGKSFIETFHWLVPMSKKTDVTGIYNLFNLKELRLEFSKESKTSYYWGSENTRFILFRRYG